MFPALFGLPGIEGWLMRPGEGLVFLARLLGALWSCGLSSDVSVMVGGGVSLTCCCNDTADMALGGRGSRPITEPDPEAATQKIRPLHTETSHNGGSFPVRYFMAVLVFGLHSTEWQDDWWNGMDLEETGYYSSICLATSQSTTLHWTILFSNEVFLLALFNDYFLNAYVIQCQMRDIINDELRRLS
jgi:hypothetical protein